MRSGIRLAIDQLDRIARASNHAVEMIGLDIQDQPMPRAIAEISVVCRDMRHSSGGLKLRHREKLQIHIYDSYPYKPPSAAVPHGRFSGHPHVQSLIDDSRHFICLYQAPSQEWNPSEGMYGYLERLELWLRMAALNQLDPAGAYMHPPAVYVSDGAAVVIRADTPAVGKQPWLGYAELEGIAENRADLVGWTHYTSELKLPYVGAAILLSEPLPWEITKSPRVLLDELDARGVSKEHILALLGLTVLRNTAEANLYLFIGSPSRGISGTAQRLQHVTAWRFSMTGSKCVELASMRLTSDAELRKIGERASELMEEWIDSATISWCRVLESRQEIVLPRDASTRTAIFRSRAVSLWGCGALGGPIAEMLVRSGVSVLDITDNGIVNPGILVRQPYNDAEVGRAKAEVLSARLTKIRRDGVSVRYRTSDILASPLGGGDWSDGADIVIDTTASNAVIAKLELRRLEQDVAAHVASLIIGHDSTRGFAVVAGRDYSGGAQDVTRKAKIEATKSIGLEHFADEFWPTDSRGPLFQPEPGCSEPTFLGASADSLGLAGTLLNLVARSLSDLDKHPNRAIAHFLSQYYDDETTHATFVFPQDSILIDKKLDFEIRISPSAIEQMKIWIERSSLRRGKQVETGGVLFGELDEASKVIWVSSVSGPPSDSVCSAAHFICGVNGVALRTKRSMQETRGSIHYVGMWHTHPGGPAQESEQDRSAMSLLLATEYPVSRFPLMLILGLEASSSIAEIGAYVYSEQRLASSRL